MIVSVSNRILETLVLRKVCRPSAHESAPLRVNNCVDFLLTYQPKPGRRRVGFLFCSESTRPRHRRAFDGPPVQLIVDSSSRVADHPKPTVVASQQPHHRLFFPAWIIVGIDIVER